MSYGRMQVGREALRVLEFYRILEAMAGYANSTATREAVLAILPLPDQEAILERFGRIEEIRAITRLGVPLRLAPFEDVRPLLDELGPEGAMVAPRDLATLIPLLRVMTAIASQMAYRTDIPLLKELAGGVSGFPDLLKTLERTVDSEGHILDTASPQLMELRERKRALAARIRKRLEEIVREKQIALFLQDDFITQRAGRWVIPVRMDSKGMVAGVAHDVSNSGETAFMEPLEIIPLANELENLVADEKAEEIRVIRNICRWLRSLAEELAEEFRVLVQFDLLNSIASFADLLDAEIPRIGDGFALDLKRARHPLLLLMAKQGGGREVVPLDLNLGASDADGAAANRIMVITGPNTGGKTIAIKTVGLLLTMALAGIPVPAEASSTFPLASQLLLDIGDEQSIAESLSTFSAHVANMVHILKRADGRTVVLMDELGTGTDPAQGAAIACGVLNSLREQGAMALATTHLTDIVTFVHKSSGMVNASMEFDRHTFTPLYRLQPGEPGESHALEVARRCGLPAPIIDFAQGMLGRRETDFHALLAELKEERRRYQESLAGLEEERRRLAEEGRLLKERLAEAERTRREALSRSWQEAREVIAAARRQTRDILEEARREKSRIALKKLEAADREAESRLRELSDELPLAAEALKEGDMVFVRTLGYDAQVVKVAEKQERVRVRAGNLEVEVPLAALAPRQGKGMAGEKRPRRPSLAAVEAEEPSYELNLIGQRVDEALVRLEPFLNHASLAGLAEVRIVHGTGTGALMRGVREYLSGHPLVLEFRGGEQYEGGNGVTIVKLR